MRYVIIVNSAAGLAGARPFDRLTRQQTYFAIWPAAYEPPALCLAIIAAPMAPLS